MFDNSITAAKTRRKNYAHRTKASPKSVAIRGKTGLTPKQEARATHLLRIEADRMFGGAPQSDEDRGKLHGHVAALLRREPGPKATKAQVRDLAQRLRNPQPGTPPARPVELALDYYAFVDALADTLDVSKKAALHRIIDAYREVHPGI